MYLRRLVLLIFMLHVLVLHAHEGMWIPSTLAKLVIDDMRNAGLKLSAEEIYSINQSSIKDAIVLFGGGCTAEVISDQGLILTNHHCGYSQIQSHSSVENDYLRNGFWAMNRSQELPNAGLSATFVVRIEDVTERIEKASDGLNGFAEQSAMRAVAAAIQKEATQGTHYQASIKPFYFGNAYYLIVTETFNDVRLTGAPPSAIGKFGGDTDNWEWPRHTGDFAIFRIYAGADNKPAPYHPDNKPYKPKYSLAVNMDGVQEGDYTMVFGFPGRTDQYLTSYAVQYVLDESNPMRYAMRKASLSVIDAAMASNDTIRIKYAAKQSRISNAHKKWIGQSQGLKAYDAIGKKKAQEAAFMAAAEREDPGGFSTQLLPLLEELYLDNNAFSLAYDLYVEMYFYGPEIVRFAGNFMTVATKFDSLQKAGGLDAELAKLQRTADGFFKNYDARVDEAIFAAQAPLYSRWAPGVLQLPVLVRLLNKHGGDGSLAAREIYRSSPFCRKARIDAFLQKPTSKMARQMAADPALQMASEISRNYQRNVKAGLDAFRDVETQLMAAYLEATMRYFPDRNYSPDANGTLRITYGRMEGSSPRDGMAYLPYTTLDGVVQKYIPGDVEFDLPERLLELHTNRDYGPYATDGALRVCFLGSHHTTGGNSGSPALNAWGDLVGLNFDRTWESTMSDIMFNPDICRNIMVDIKYVLWVVDKYAGAGHLVKEMKLISRKEADPMPDSRQRNTMELQMN